ncbi:unannotated protein [freshwater metagenome]|uniref:Unannotated protein n=1 Tax=freshwater metagenome TaxID=449393 RepID=A0A6J6YSM9_9ZZZZ
MGTKSDIKDLDEHFTDVMSNPLIEDSTQEIAVLFSGD